LLTRKPAIYVGNIIGLVMNVLMVNGILMNAGWTYLGSTISRSRQMNGVTVSGVTLGVHLTCHAARVSLRPDALDACERWTISPLKKSMPRVVETLFCHTCKRKA
jgi:hypothetical protein